MDHEELHAFILDRLSGAVNPDEIVMELCERHGLNWPEAEALVLQVLSEHENTITRRQSPLLAIIALGLFLGGIGMVAFAAYSLFETSQAYLGGPLFYTDIPGFMFYLVDYAYFALSLLFVGAGMMLGSLVGMRRVWAAILNF